MKRLALSLLLVGLAPLAAFGADNPVDGLFQQAQAATTARKFDDALHLYERVFLEHPEAADRWFDAQGDLVVTLARKGDLAEAAKAAHIYLDSAPDSTHFRTAVELAAHILSAMDKHVDRANQFLHFQQSGPSNGLTNPMDAIGYPSLPERERAFAAVRQQAGDDAAASRLRAFTFLFTGKPKDAMAQFADAFRRSSQWPDLHRSGPELVTIGLRAVRGHGVGLETSLPFVVFGPKGPDGKPNTADDIADPFADFLPAPPAPGEGGLAGLSAENLNVLRQVHDAARLYAADPCLPGGIRLAGLLALARSNDALDNWGAPGQKDGYLQMAPWPWGVKKAQRSTNDRVLEYQLLCGAQTAARGRALHFGGVYPLWNAIDAYGAAQGIKPTEGMDRARKQFGDACAGLNRTHFQVPPLKMLNKPASF